MAKKNQDQADAAPARPKKPAPRAAPGLPWHPAWRWLVSLLLVLHLAAISVAPWNLSTDPALPPGYVAPTGSQPLPPRDSTVWQQPVVPRGLHRFFNDYLNLAYLNHGYQFFAPDPAGSNLIRYQVWDSGGAEISAGEFPNLDQQWPRLLYHRHMMLAAQTGDMGEQSGRLYARHLIRLHGGQTGRVEWILHKLLSPQQVLDETPLDAESTYVVLAEIRETADTTLNPPSEETPVAIPGAGR
ncbi:MAG: hypothetical protein GXP28_02665 [Planctomycetes bacterium]|nr:hypothetical protein [Planctomycetota bacterium]